MLPGFPNRALVCIYPAVWRHDLPMLMNVAVRILAWVTIQRRAVAEEESSATATGGRAALRPKVPANCLIAGASNNS